MGFDSNQQSLLPSLILKTYTQPKTTVIYPLPYFFKEKGVMIPKTLDGHNFKIKGSICD